MTLKNNSFSVTVSGTFVHSCACQLSGMKFFKTFTIPSRNGQDIRQAFTLEQIDVNHNVIADSSISRSLIN